MINKFVINPVVLKYNTCPLKRIILIKDDQIIKVQYKVPDNFKKATDTVLLHATLVSFDFVKSSVG